jgi:putative ABC transport system permease protein
MALYLAENADENTIRAKLPISLKVQNNTELRKTVLNIFDQTFQISYLFFWIALIISVLTVALTLFSCIEENAYLNQIKYYLGTTLGQIFSFELMQGFLIVCTALAFSLPAGYWLAYILKNTINNNSFGWIIYLNPNLQSIAFISGLAIFGALIGCLLPLFLVYRRKKMLV